MNRKASLLLATVALLAVSLPAFAQWKWKDANGKVQYSDMPPPPGTPEANILQRPAGAPPVQVVVIQNGKPVNQAAAAAAPASAASAPPTKAELDAQAKKKQELADQQAKQKAADAKVAAQKRDSCARARENLATLESGVPLRTGAGGDFLSDDQRAAEMQRARSTMNSDCGG